MCWSLSLCAVCGRWVTEGWTEEDLETHRLARGLRGVVRKTGESCRYSGNSRKGSREWRQGSVPALSDSWCGVVEGEGVDFRGRGVRGRQRGTCCLAPEVSRVSTAGLWRKTSEHCGYGPFGCCEMDLNWSADHLFIKCLEAFGWRIPWRLQIMDSDSDSPFNYSWPSFPKMRMRRKTGKKGNTEWCSDW